MGLTYIEGALTGPSGKQRNVRFLVDSGANYSLLPLDVWRELELQPKRAVSFTLADGTQIQRQVSECHLALAGQDGHSPVILGEPGDMPPFRKPNNRLSFLLVRCGLPLAQRPFSADKRTIK